MEHGKGDKHEREQKETEISTAVHQYISTSVHQYISTAVQQYSSTAVQQTTLLLTTLKWARCIAKHKGVPTTPQSCSNRTASEEALFVDGFVGFTEFAEFAEFAGFVWPSSVGDRKQISTHLESG